MSGIREAAGNVSPAVLINLRRPLFVAVGLTVIGIVVAAVLGHVVMGILFGVGLGMGLFNARMMQKQVLRVISSENPTKRAITGSSAQRLLILTLIALAMGYFLRPDGLGVFIGLAVFQLVFVANTMLPVLKERRNQ
ncbi:MAG TPA: ATP synthase subunit I [Amycolatopsis sp.]|nr:ATP synthase subunit I [Amycolatopsis sp.]